jgi:hypothetical protein
MQVVFVDERATLRQQINTRADNTITALVEKQPDLAGEFDACVGYFVGRISGVKAPVVGAGIGMGFWWTRCIPPAPIWTSNDWTLALAWVQEPIVFLFCFMNIKCWMRLGPAPGKRL